MSARSMHRSWLTALLTVAAACGGTQSTHPSEAPSSSPPPPNDSTRPSDDEMRPPSASRTVPIIELRNDASPLVTFRVVFQSGSADDPAGKEGLTHVAAELMVEGGTEALTFQELTRRLFPMAATIVAQVDRDMTVFTAQVHRDHVATFYPLFRDVLLHPRLGDDDFRRVRTQALSALTLELRGNDDEQLGREAVQSLVYAAHPYGHPTLGTERGLGALAVADVRAHRTQVFCRDRVMAGVAGGYPADLASTLRHDLEQLPATCAPAVALPTPVRPHGLHVLVIDKPSASATAISLATPVEITRADPDFAAVQFYSNYIGLHRQSSGVLYQTIREARGLNYGDYMYAEHFVQETSSRFPMPNVQRRQQYASVWLRPMRPDAAHFALRAAVRAVSRTLEQGLSAEEFDRARAFLAGYIGLYVQTESQRLGYALDDAWIHATGGLFPDRLRDAWQRLDRDAALALARRQLTARDAWVAIVAPNARALADAIGHNAPSPITYDSPKPPAVVAEDAEIAQYVLPVRSEDVQVVPLAEVFR